MLAKLLAFFTGLFATKEEDVPATAPQIEPPPPSPSPSSESNQDRAARAENRRLSALRRRIADSTADILDRFEKLDRSNSRNRINRADDVAILDNLWACDFHFVDELAEATEGAEKICLRPDGDEVELANTTWPIDIAAVVRKDGYFLLDRVCTTNPSELRGKIKVVPTKIVTCSAARLFDDGTWDAEEGYYGLLGGKWRSISTSVVSRQTQNGILVREKLSTKEINAVDNTSISLSFSMALTERYSWHVAFGYGGESEPRIILPTSPSGALDLFKTREIAAGRTRREALRHWVSNHYRSMVNDGIAYVRDHLRGGTRFRWSDMECELMVSQFDLEKNEMFRLQAADWRASRKHNRVRVRLKRKLA
jgi:hypothetical protein